MVEKTIVAVPVQVNAAALAPLGWTAQEVRARLVTETRSGGAVMQWVAVAGSVLFRAGDWTERFGGTGHAPHVMLTLNRRGSTSAPCYGQVVAESATVAARRPIRFAETSEPWSSPVPTPPEDLQIRLTGYDLDSVQGFLGLQGDSVTALPVTVLDESTWPSLPVKVQASAEITREEHGDQVRVHIDGVVEPGSVEELLADWAAHGPGPFDDLAKVRRLAVPGFVVEVTDDSDFLLARRTVQFHGAVTVDEATGAPRRAARFVAGFRAGSAAYAGTPAQVVLRVLDASDIRPI